MKYELLHLKQFFPNLGTQSGDPLVKVYLPDNLTEMGRDDEQHPCLIVCPGGAYEFCSQREAEPIAFHFLPEPPRKRSLPEGFVCVYLNFTNSSHFPLAFHF